MGIQTAGTLWCKGDNTWGQIGDGTTEFRDTYVPVGDAVDWTAIVVRGDARCGIRPGWTDIAAYGGVTCGVRGGNLYCWGQNTTGQLGVGDTSPRNSPAQVGGAAGWTMVAPATSSTCGIQASKLFCWGDNSVGQLGTGTVGPPVLEPVQIGNEATWTHVATSLWGGCGVKRDGSLWCWGLHSGGSLGFGDVNTALVPRRIN